MIPPSYTDSLGPQERLQEVARILAEGLLRRRLRRLRDMRQRRVSRENSLELLPTSRTHRIEPSREGEAP